MMKSIPLPDSPRWIMGQLIEADRGASLVDAHPPLEFQGIAREAKAQTA
jgi:hypothetical protein